MIGYQTIEGNQFDLQEAPLGDNNVLENGSVRNDT